MHHVIGVTYLRLFGGALYAVDFLSTFQVLIGDKK